MEKPIFLLRELPGDCFDIGFYLESKMEGPVLKKKQDGRITLFSYKNNKRTGNGIVLRGDTLTRGRLKG